MCIYEYYTDYEALNMFRNKIEKNQVGKADLNAMSERFAQMMSELEATKRSYGNYVDRCPRIPSLATDSTP